MTVLSLSASDEIPMDGIVPDIERCLSMAGGKYQEDEARCPTLALLMPDSADVLDKLRDLVAKDNPAEDTVAMHTRAMALVARLKALNRTANTATRVCKDKTAAARLEMDQSHLQLQNLLYEKRHLEREIDKCRQFACVVHFPCASMFT